jgi:transcriptional regulator with XRE-family HTH domain
MDLVLKLRELRRMRGLSQKDAARLSGIGEKSISSFETGNRIDSLKISQLDRLLKVYGVNEKTFFGEELETMIDPWEEDEIGQRARALFERMDDFSDSLRTTILDKLQLIIETAEEVQAVANAAAQPRPYANEHIEWQMLTSRN